MHLPALIRDLAIILLTGGFVTVLFRKIKQPVVLGYILAGFLIGPYVPLFFGLSDTASVETWSEIGIIILMFSHGLEFNLHKLAKLSVTAVITAVTEVLGLLLFGYFTGQALGWSTMDSVFLGGMLSMNSTTIIIKSFDELDVRKEHFAQLVCGTLVIEDIAGIFIMIILSTVSVSKSVSGGELVVQLSLLLLYLILWLLLGIFIVPTVLKKMKNFMTDETLLIVSLGICFGMVLLADFLGFSSALGAFLAGSLLAGTVLEERITSLTNSVKDLFGAVFFISVGMMLNPRAVLDYWLPILIVCLVTVIGKLTFSTLGVLLSGHPLRSAVKCGASLAQIGEFAFIIASLGLSLGVIADFIYPIIISVSVITTLTTPYFIKGSDKIYDIYVKILPKKLVDRLDRMTSETTSDKEENDPDWALYLKRYAFRTLFYGFLMLAFTMTGRYLLLPVLTTRLTVAYNTAVIITMVFAYALMSLFIRPYLDIHSTLYRTIWVKDKSYHLPLIALRILRLSVLVLLFFLPLRFIAMVHSILFLPLIILFIYLLASWDKLGSAYLDLEAQFLANLNERQLAMNGIEDNTKWLDNQLFIEDFIYYPSAHGEKRSLKHLGWGHQFHVNVVKIVRDGKHIFMPSGDFELVEGDRVFIIGEREQLRSFRMTYGLDIKDSAKPLHQFIEKSEHPETDLFTYALPVDKTSALAGKTIQETDLRQRLNCMILGLQKGNLPISNPSVRTVIHPGDIVWLLGNKQMASELLQDVDL